MEALLWETSRKGFLRMSVFSSWGMGILYSPDTGKVAGMDTASPTSGKRR
jgi:hypothetical protein